MIPLPRSRDCSKLLTQENSCVIQHCMARWICARLFAWPPATTALQNLTTARHRRASHYNCCVRITTERICCRSAASGATGRGTRLIKPSRLKQRWLGGGWRGIEPARAVAGGGQNRTAGLRWGFKRALDGWASWWPPQCAVWLSLSRGGWCACDLRTKITPKSRCFC